MKPLLIVLLGEVLPIALMFFGARRSNRTGEDALTGLVQFIAGLLLFLLVNIPLLVSLSFRW